MQVKYNMSSADANITFGQKHLKKPRNELDYKKTSHTVEIKRAIKTMSTQWKFITVEAKLTVCCDNYLVRQIWISID